MDIAAYVRRSPANADRNRSVLQDILEGTLYSPFLLIIDNVANSSLELLQNVKERGARTIEACSVANLSTTERHITPKAGDLPAAEGFILLKDLTVELILNSNETIRDLAIAIKSCSGTKQASKWAVVTH
jgi:hypothetical protein